MIQRGREDEDGLTPLMRAIERDCTDLARALIKHGASLDTRRDGNGPTALHVAVEMMNEEIVALLLEKGADRWHEIPPDGLTPLLLAASVGYKPVLQIFVPNETDVDAQNEAGRTALMVAAEKGNLEAVKWLLERGAYPRAYDDDGWSALHNAAYVGNASLVRVLLDAGAVPWAMTKQGGTPFPIACGSLALEAARELLKPQPNEDDSRLPPRQWRPSEHEVANALRYCLEPPPYEDWREFPTKASEDRIRQLREAAPSRPALLRLLIDKCGARVTDEIQQVARLLREPEIDEILAAARRAQDGLEPPGVPA